MALLERARGILFSAALLLLAGAAWAMQSSSLSFTNTRSAMNSAGLRKTSADFRVDGAVGLLAQTAENSASFHGRDGLIPGYYYPSGTALSGSTVTASGTGTAILQWVSPGNDGNEHSTPGGYIVRFSSSAGQSPSISDALFNAAANVTPAPPAAAIQGTTITMTVTGLTSGVAYYFAVKTFERDGTRSALSKAIQSLNLPQEPYGIAVTTLSATTISLRWFPVVRYTDGASFAISTAPTASELGGYHVYRATAPTQAPWTDVADLSTATLTWTDFSGGSQYFYNIAASNAVGLSNPSVVRSAGDRSVYVVASDGASYFQIGAQYVEQVEGVVGQPNSAYLITAANRVQDLGAVGGTVVKSVEFDAYQGGVLLAPNLPLPAQGMLHLNYQVSSLSGSVTPSGVAATPSNMSVYWNSGASWVQLYGTLDSANRMMTLQTLYLGQYQLRTVERAGAFSFSMAGVSNRFLTPNGDHKNDNVVFTYDNPQGANVSIKIFDARGHVVASNLPMGPTAYSQVWDGTSGGRTVPGGVYVYQIQGEGQTYSGTLVVIK